GAYDPIDEMAEICKKYNIWLHADGSFGGSIILSEKHRHLMKGIEQTDSFAWNPHKLMNIPLICSALLVKKRGTLQHNITDINT
ncbi:MAG: cysteine synthase, partial [Bacteroidetes bacterium]|nr:cysteine synthase [Bacteroidota bacterium]